MIRRINFTGRKKILRDDARVSVRPDADGVLAFDAALSLADYELPEDAKVFVEAYRQTTLMRFPHGTVAAPQPPRDAPRRLTEFPTSDALLFRVKVTSAGERAGVLLAEADRIPVSDDGDRPDKPKPLLRWMPADIGDEIWQLDYGGSEVLLLLNSKLRDCHAVHASPWFQSVIYPAAMRQVLWHVVTVRQVHHVDDPNDWGSLWLRFASSLGGDPPQGEPDRVDEKDWRDWIDVAVESFARRHKLLDQFARFIEREASA